MQTGTPKPDAVSSDLIRIAGTEILPVVQPTISVGEVLRVTVRNNSAGQGQLYLRGTLIPATLPEDLQSGDRLLTQVTQAGDQLILKLLSAERASSLPAQTGVGPRDVIGNLSQSLQNALGPKLLGVPSLPLPELGASSTAPTLSGAAVDTSATAHSATDNAAGVLAAVTTELEHLIGEEILRDPKLLTEKLKHASSGVLGQALSRLAAQLRAALDPTLGANAQVREAYGLKRAMESALESAISSNSESAQGLDELIELLRRQLQSSPSRTPKDRDALRATIAELRTAPGESSPQEALSRAIAKFETTLPPLTKAVEKHTVAEANEMRVLANRLDDLATAQQQLHQLNTVMQALGEPALILFPFLTVGMLGHGELAFDTTGHGDGRDGGRATTDDREESVDTSAYQRIHLSVPLPALGTVSVDLAYRKEEIFLRLTINDRDGRNFLDEHLAHLDTELRALNFTVIELRTNLAPPTMEAPAWYLELLRGQAVVA